MRRRPVAHYQQPRQPPTKSQSYLALAMMLTDESTMGTPARFAVALRSTAECIGLFAAAQKRFEKRGVDFQLVAFDTAAERGIEGPLSG